MPDNHELTSQPPPRSRDGLIAYLAEGPRTRVEAWLVAALRGQIALPDHRADESPYLAVLRVEPALPSSARRDLEAACQRLVIVLCRGDEQDVAYASALLALVADLHLPDCAAPLAAAARTFPERPHLSLALKRRILGALLDLRVSQPAALWSELLAREPGLAGAAFAGLLRTSPRDALAALSDLPDRSSLADSVTLTLEQEVAAMAKARQDGFIPQLFAVLDRCKPNLRATIDSWLEHAGYAVAAPTVAPRSPHSEATRRHNLGGLAHALAGRNPAFNLVPGSARLP